jgi:hypothetical protein
MYIHARPESSDRAAIPRRFFLDSSVRHPFARSAAFLPAMRPKTAPVISPMPLGVIVLMEPADDLAAGGIAEGRRAKSQATRAHPTSARRQPQPDRAPFSAPGLEREPRALVRSRFGPKQRPHLGIGLEPAADEDRRPGV